MEQAMAAFQKNAIVLALRPDSIQIAITSSSQTSTRVNVGIPLMTFFTHTVDISLHAFAPA